ncbi:MAG: DUF3343 domain-containing protein [Anaerosomatales bacterium]|nr:DUF3343 domain-containing protein [Anaerosomatales bacterium]MDT8434099.1 DUF3343 domain-containing protein [Anaerosomatales bacterium]
MSGRPLRTFAVLGFATTHTALAAEQLLRDLGVPVTPIPAPASIGNGLCGIALRLEPGDVERADTLLERAELRVAARGDIEDV